MTNSSLVTLSNDLADLVAGQAPTVVQVLGARRPASGVIHGTDTILTTARAIGRENGVRVRIGDSDPIEAEMVGWDPATGIAVLRCGTKLSVAPSPIAETEPRVGGVRSRVVRAAAAPTATAAVMLA